MSQVLNKEAAVMDPKVFFPKFPRTGNPTLVYPLRRRQANFYGSQSRHFRNVVETQPL